MALISIHQPVELRQLCADARAILEAALVDAAAPNDTLSSRAPEFLVQPAEPVTDIRKMTPFGADSGYWRIGWQGKPPPPELVRRWYAMPYGSISRCFEPRNESKPLLTIIGAKLFQFSPFNGPAPSDVHVSFPAFDATKTHAILLYSRFYRHGFRGGNLDLVFLTRTKSGWKKTGSRNLGSV